MRVTLKSGVVRMIGYIVPAAMDLMNTDLIITKISAFRDSKCCLGSDALWTSSSHRGAGGKSRHVSCNFEYELLPSPSLDFTV
jgi:hypothetical protein